MAGPSFPEPVMSKGATFTPLAHSIRSFIMLIVNDPMYKSESFWHELGHCLLDTPAFDPVTKKKIDDHSINYWEPVKGSDYTGKDKEWLLTAPPAERLRGAYLPPKAVARMQETARTKFQ